MPLISMHDGRHRPRGMTEGKIAHANVQVKPTFSNQRPAKQTLETLLNNTPNSVFDMARFAGGST